ncbi:MAG: DoxX family protein, partial [Acidimicrobiia bacterium]
TPTAAAALAVEQVGAAIVHGRRKEAQMIPVNLVLIAVAVFIAWGRFGNYSL